MVISILGAYLNILQIPKTIIYFLGLYYFYIVIKKKLNKEYYNKKMDYNGNLIPINDYFPYIIKNSFYSGDFELAERILLFNKNKLELFL